MSRESERDNDVVDATGAPEHNGDGAARGSLTLLGRRIRAAMILADVDTDTLAFELNISRRTLERTMYGTREPRAWELRRIEEVLRLPEWFLEHGLDGRPVDAADAVDEDYRFNRVEQLLEGLAEGVAELLDRSSS